ncbi:hypothetical protein KUM39_01070 [Streptomyces sp. J2-1]|uniref:hypothetical protein n=1 Tax=Streptomyces corallincola TaxID=2851888 RepID=UPI001C394B83|nr:hypothetical protein [Streptomyces corallincola]MBV2352959.1 hypothetical protein [Streptomyces corallincola]
MRTSRLLLRSGLLLATAAALPTALAGSSAAATGISVSTTGSTVSVVTSACTQSGGAWGNASLLTSRQANFSQGRQVALSGTTISQSAAWSGVTPGTYTVVVVCSNGITAGTQAVVVSGTSTGAGVATGAPTTSSTSAPAPARGVQGGVGGSSHDFGPVTMSVGLALVASGIAGAIWFLRRRSRPYRL